MRTVHLLMALALAAGACGAGDSNTVSPEGSSATALSDEAPTSSTAPARMKDGATAVWSTDSDDPPTRTTESFTALVTRLGCSGGETGEVLPPNVSVEDAQIVVTFMVEALPEGDYTCPGNDLVPYVVELSEPVGERKLIDGACLSGEAVTTSFCAGAIRWAP